MTAGVAHAVDVPEHLVAPRYGYAEADRLAGVSPGTSRRWSAGYSYHSRDGERVSKPPVGKTTAQSVAAVSFADLVEVAAIRGLRDLGFSLPQIREVVRGCQDVFESERPLLSHRFKVGGRDAFVEEPGGVLVSVLEGRRKTAWDKVLSPFLETVEYDGEWAFRWWPRGRSTQVVVDPRFGFGLPVAADTGVRTEVLFERAEVGESVEQIAADFGVAAEVVRDAIEFERFLSA